MKTGQHFKSVSLAQPALAVDKKAGVIRQVVILQEGPDKNGGFFTPEFLGDLIEAGNAKPQGVKSRFGHPNLCANALGSFIGRYKNFRASNEDGRYKVVADLHLDAITKKTAVEGQGISMYDYLMEMADRNPDAFGNSIHFTGSFEMEKQQVNGQETELETYRLDSLIASDLVDSPAATDSLFKSVEEAAVSDRDEALLEPLIRQYINGLKSKKKMCILRRIKKSLGVMKDIDLTLADGRTLVTVEGLITEIKEPEKPDDSAVSESLKKALEEPSPDAGRRGAGQASTILYPIQTHGEVSALPGTTGGAYRQGKSQEAQHVSNHSSTTRTEKKQPK